MSEEPSGALQHDLDTQVREREDACGGEAEGVVEVGCRIALLPRVGIGIAPRDRLVGPLGQRYRGSRANASPALLPASEHPLQVGACDHGPGGTAVGTMVAEVDFVHPREQGPHLGV